MEDKDFGQILLEAEKLQEADIIFGAGAIAGGALSTILRGLFGLLVKKISDRKAKAGELKKVNDKETPDTVIQKLQNMVNSENELKASISNATKNKNNKQLIQKAQTDMEQYRTNIVTSLCAIYDLILADKNYKNVVKTTKTSKVDNAIVASTTPQNNQ